MKEKTLPRDQYLLRVKRNSELDVAIEALMEDGLLTDEQLADLSGVNRTGWLVRLLPKLFDNIGVIAKPVKNNPRQKTHKINYTSVMPNQVNVVTSDVNFSGSSDGHSAQSDSGELEAKMRWPIAPPLIESMENFDKPSFYNIMKVMVGAGKHISLEGPPSVGKDTAVEQLAADMGKPLVTIGGDAGFRTRDLTGGQQIVNGTSFYDIGEYVTAAVNGWWVLLTEVNAADPSAIMYINRQLAAPYVVNLGGKSYPVHPDFRLFVTYNHGLVGTKPLPQSFKDRFFSVKVPFFKKHTLTKRLVAMGMPEYSVSASDVDKWTEGIVRFGVSMWDAHERGQMRYQITTRRLKDAVDLIMLADVPVKDALKKAVIAAIDSPTEAKAAVNVLNSIL